MGLEEPSIFPMPLSASLSPEEFTSLTSIGSGPLLGTPIPPDHVLKLTELKFVEALFGGYAATVTGRIRIASGN